MLIFAPQLGHLLLGPRFMLFTNIPVLSISPTFYKLDEFNLIHEDREYGKKIVGNLDFKGHVIKFSSDSPLIYNNEIQDEFGFTFFIESPHFQGYDFKISDLENNDGEVLYSILENMILEKKERDEKED